MRESGFLIYLREGVTLIRCNIDEDFVYTFLNEKAQMVSRYWNHDKSCFDFPHRNP